MVGADFLTASVSEPDPEPEVPSMTLGVRMEQQTPEYVAWSCMRTFLDGRDPAIILSFLSERDDATKRAELEVERTAP